MIRSMTAFAREERRDDSGEMTWEIRSVNHRYLEVFVRLPEELRAIEPQVRERIGNRLGRGKVECALRYRSAGSTDIELQVNRVLVSQLMQAAGTVADLTGQGQGLSVSEILRWPGVLDADNTDPDRVHKAALELLDKTIDDLVDAREREGGKLAELITQRLEDMSVQVQRARERMPEVVAETRQRLSDKLAEFSVLDEGRVEQEMVMLCQRLDVDEEMDRLQTHLGEVARTLKQDKPVGRRLDFLMQELNREANTLGSKSADVMTTSVSVEMKVLIEQMREQIQNIE